MWKKQVQMILQWEKHAWNSQNSQTVKSVILHSCTSIQMHLLTGLYPRIILRRVYFISPTMTGLFSRTKAVLPNIQTRTGELAVSLHVSHWAAVLWSDWHEMLEIINDGAQSRCFNLHPHRFSRLMHFIS